MKLNRNAVRIESNQSHRVSSVSILLTCLPRIFTVTSGLKTRTAAWLIGTLAVLVTAGAADPSQYLGQQSRHRILSSDAPPGYLGGARLNGRGPVAGYFQPVAFSGPKGTQFALVQGGAFAASSELFQAGLMIGGVYRFRITHMPEFEGAELYPTIEVIDRTYPPPGLATRYPIRVDLDHEDFRAALDGQLVTRVIYLEDPQTATPIVQDKDTTRAIDIRENQDALEVADRYGRPVAIVRIGSMAPPRSPELMPQFLFGSPVWAPIFHPEVAAQPENYPTETAIQQ